MNFLGLRRRVVFLSRDSRDLAHFEPFDEAEIWSHGSFPNLICKNLGQDIDNRFKTKFHA